jgi:class 3 adenylate cyclase/predicted ATPase
MKFCGQCGVALPRLCLACGFENPAGFKFCGQCGAAILKDEGGRMKDEAVQPSSLILHPSTEAQRRHLTVMFCDLVGSTNLSEQLDPEELREVLQAYQQTCAAVIQRFEGYIAQYLGDGLLVYFGYPLAHEDDAHRAVRTGLGILGEMEQLSAHLQIELAVRLGIHTGLVVVGEIGAGQRHEQLALGETINLAARLQSLTAPNTIAISAATQRLNQGFFEVQHLGYHTLKGFSQPVEIYRVIRERPRRSRLELSAAAGLTPLIGREQELGLLLARWGQAHEKQGQVVLLSGEPGIGKSRLGQTFKSRLTGQPHLWLECRCSPYYQNSALYPIIELLQRLFGFKESDSPDRKLAKLVRRLNVLMLNIRTFNRDEAVYLLVHLLSLPWPPDRDPPLNLSTQRQKQKTLETLLALLWQLSTQRPTAIMVEDLHWADPSTLEILTMLVDQAPTARVLGLFTFRPSFTPPWPARSHLTFLTLNRLSQAQTQDMIKELVSSKSLPPSLLPQLAAKTDGVPLFVEELTKMVLEQGLVKEPASNYQLTDSLPSLAIPTTLQDLLMARLDQLATGREVAQLGAVIGREFSYDLLQAIWPLDEATLQNHLARLVQTELLYQRGQPPRAVYIFKHVMIQETAYRSLLRRQRQQYHRQLAQFLADHAPEIVETQPELLAHHFSRAGMVEAALDYWQQAGQRAIAHSANLEAIHHLQQALALLPHLPPTSQRLQQELALQIALGGPLLMAKGYAAAEIEQAYGRAKILCQQMGETPQLFSALFGLWVFYLVRADLPTARQLADQLRQVAENLQNPLWHLEADQAMGVTLFYQGHLATALSYLERVNTSYNPHRHRLQTGLGGADLGVICLSHAALTLWLCGYPDQASQRSQAALALAQQLNHPFSQAFALCFTAWLHQFCQAPEPTLYWAKAALTLSIEHGFALSAAFGAIFCGWADPSGLGQLQTALNTYQATGAELGRTQFLSLLAQQYAQVGQVEAALAVLNEALIVAEQNGERFWTAELYRLRGELGLEAKAEADFQHALKIAQAQGAKLLAIRAAASLVGLFERAGPADQLNQARLRLTEVEAMEPPAH